MINSTAASTPTRVTGHETPRRYGPRITKISKTSMPAKKSASVEASNVVVQTRHFLCDNTIQPSHLAPLSHVPRTTVSHDIPHRILRKRSGKTHRPYRKHCAQLSKHSAQKHCGWIWIGMLKFCTIAYTPKGTAHSAHRNIMVAGSPSVDLVR